MKKLLSLILVAIMLVTAMPMAVAEGNTYEVGDIIQFGTYPQSKVTDETLIAELNVLAPEWADWTSYGYYMGNGQRGSMVQGNWMRYIDVTYNGAKYRGVEFMYYRPYSTFDKSSLEYTDQSDNGYNQNNIYWFKFEPIDWYILDPSAGFVMCKIIIDSQPFSNTQYYNGGSDLIHAYFSDSSYKNYACDYETSSIREWLNDDFFTIAFTEGEKKAIRTTTLNNDSYNTLKGYSNYNKLDGNETQDKIFLLSYNDVKDENFVLGLNSYNRFLARRAQGSDYAQSQGLRVYRVSGSSAYGCSNWFLRSPGDYSDFCCSVDITGDLNYRGLYDVSSTNCGIRPAFYFDDISKVHKQHTYKSEITTPATHLSEGVITYTCECSSSYTEIIPKIECCAYEAITIEPTCINKGFTKYVCACGRSYKDNFVDAKGHSYSSIIITSPTHLKEGEEIVFCECGLFYEQIIPKLDSHIFISEVITLEPSHLVKGIKTFTCYCGYSYTEPIPKLEGHNYITIVTYPTCTAQGYTTYTCECGDSYIGNFVDERHTFSTEWTIDEEPTCRNEGLKSRHCKFCPARTDIKTIDKLEHNFVSVRVEPSCLDEGYIMTGCNCGIETIEVIPAKGHNFNGFSCTECDYDKSFDCSCNCHKSGLAHLFFKIILFFQKLFRTNSVCTCGAVHY